MPRKLITLQRSGHVQQNQSRNSSTTKITSQTGPYSTGICKHLQGSHLQETDIEGNLTSQLIIRQIPRNDAKASLNFKTLKPIQNSVQVFLSRYIQNLEGCTISTILWNRTRQAVVSDITEQTTETNEQ